VQSSLGYWVEWASQFAWVDFRPEDPYRIEYESALKFTNSIAYDLDRPIPHGFIESLNHALDRAVHRTLNLNRTSDEAFSNYVTRIIEHTLAPILLRDLTLDRNHVIASVLSSTLNMAFTIEHVFVFDLYVDLLTLQQRIAGRSPAFEGIRLVKERIK
jgi:hypothetical protein